MFHEAMGLLLGDASAGRLETGVRSEQRGVHGMLFVCSWWVPLAWGATAECHKIYAGFSRQPFYFQPIRFLWDHTLPIQLLVCFATIYKSKTSSPYKPYFMQDTNNRLCTFLLAVSNPISSPLAPFVIKTRLMKN